MSHQRNRGTLADVSIFLFSLFLPIELLGSSRKEHIAATIKRRLYESWMTPMMAKTVLDLLHSLGVDDADIRFDNFGG